MKQITLKIPGLDTQQQTIPALPGFKFSANATAGHPNPYTLAEIVSAFLNVAFLIAGFLLLIWLTWGIMQYIFAGGDKTALQKARSRITWAIVGFIIIILSFTISELVKNIVPTQTIILNPITNPTAIPSVIRPTPKPPTPTPALSGCDIGGGVVLNVNQSDCGLPRNPSTNSYHTCLGNNQFSTIRSCGNFAQCVPAALAAPYCQ